MWNYPRKRIVLWYNGTRHTSDCKRQLIHKKIYIHINSKNNNKSKSSQRQYDINKFKKKNSCMQACRFCLFLTLKKWNGIVFDVKKEGQIDWDNVMERERKKKGGPKTIQWFCNGLQYDWPLADLNHWSYCPITSQQPLQYFVCPHPTLFHLFWLSFWIDRKKEREWKTLALYSFIRSFVISSSTWDGMGWE